MNVESKVAPSHLRRGAYLYIRQSTLRQVLENTESTQRQYALRRRAIALGWPEERIVVIDHDLGQSGASTVQREGFQPLVAEVGLGKAGIVMELEVSRLARNCADWHRWPPDLPFIRFQTALRLRPRRARSSAEATQDGISAFLPDQGRPAILLRANAPRQ